MSDGEKLIAYMLADLMEHLEIETDIDPTFIKTAIAGDDLWAIKREHHALFHNEGPSDEVVKETSDILQMCRVLDNSMAALSPEELATINERDRDIFVGFDGNEDPHYGVAEMLVNTLDLFQERSGQSLNSHSRVMPRYRAMLEVYDRAPHSQNGTLDLEDIVAVIQADRQA